MRLGIGFIVFGLVACCTTQSVIDKVEPTTLESMSIPAAPPAPAPATPAVGAVMEIDLFGMIDEAAGEAFIAAINKAVELKASAIHVTMDSPGGEFEEAFKMSRALERVAAKLPNITCTVDGESASAAFFLLQSFPVRKATQRSSLMAHEPYVPTLTTANRARVGAILEQIRTMSSQYTEHCAARLNISAAEFRARVKGKDYDMTPADALEIGAIDEIVPSPNAKLRPPPAKPKKKKKV